VIELRAFRNTDPPALTKLWNRSVPEMNVVRPLRVHELDDLAFGTVYFDRAGLIVAQLDGEIIGYVHAGFGPGEPVASTTPFSLCRQLGTIAMLIVDPGAGLPDLPGRLVIEAERYLRSRGANVLYAGAQFPLNPFYWGLYGGSEGSAALAGHACFAETLSAMGYDPVSTIILLQCDVATCEPRDPRSVLIRRQTQLEVEEDAHPAHWWQNQALGEFHLTRFRLLDRSDATELARSTTWDMTRFGRTDGRTRIGLVDFEVSPTHRRRGYGRYLICEVLRWCRQRDTSLVELQTPLSNRAALAFYDSIGFQAIDQATIYRLPAHLLDRSLSAGQGTSHPVG
jgi:ribosomal protein S18 acetylase RimI-like enzyme